MAWQQLHLQCEKSNVDLAEALLLEAGALSIALDDAGDQPLFEPLPGESPLWDEVILTGLFDATTDDSSRHALEQLSHDIAAQVHATRIWLSAVQQRQREGLNIPDGEAANSGDSDNSNDEPNRADTWYDRAIQWF